MDNVKSTNPIPLQSTHDILRIFLIDKRSQNLTEHTLHTYELKIKAFIDSDFCASDMNEITPGDIKMFFWHYAENHKPSTTYSIYRALKLFFNWYEYELGEWDNPIRKVHPPRVPQKVIDPISLDDFTKMLPYCNIRNEAILLFLLDSGARAAEFLSLDVNDVNLISGAVFIKNGKGGKSRTVYIGSRTRKALRKYLKERKKDSQYLWTTSTGKKMTYTSLNMTIKRIAEKAGVKPPSPHDFRRAFCLNMLKSGTDLLTLAQLMGHSGITTLRLYTKLSRDDTMLAHKQGGVDKWL
jgi:integrase/recombinase XerD